MTDKKYSYDRFGSKGSRVGQAAMDTLSMAPQNITVEELMEETNKKFLQELEKSIEIGKEKFDGKFHVFVLGKKDLTQFNLSNVDRNWFVVRESDPSLEDMTRQYPNYVKTLYAVDAKAGDIQLRWSVPSKQDCKTINKNPHLYDRDLVTWSKRALAS